MYHGLCYRTELIKNNIVTGAEKCALEIGIGTGHALLTLSKKFNEIHGFDISKQSIEFLNSKIKYKNIYLDAVDICAEVNKKYYNRFDVIFSSDTLEHLSEPKIFFANVGSLLKNNGRAIIMFPNESTNNHHGITWFNKRNELLVLIPHGVKILRLVEVKKTRSFNFVINALWYGIIKLAKSTLFRMHSRTLEKPQVFDDTIAFSLNKNHPLFANVLSVYAILVTCILRCFMNFKYYELESEDITNKYLLMELIKEL